MASVGTWLIYASKNQLNSEIYAENCGELNIWFFPFEFSYDPSECFIFLQINTAK